MNPYIFSTINRNLFYAFCTSLPNVGRYTVRPGHTVFEFDLCHSSHTQLFVGLLELTISEKTCNLCQGCWRVSITPYTESSQLIQHLGVVTNHFGCFHRIFSHGVEPANKRRPEPRR